MNCIIPENTNGPLGKESHSTIEITVSSGAQVKNGRMTMPRRSDNLTIASRLENIETVVLKNSDNGTIVPGMKDNRVIMPGER